MWSRNRSILDEFVQDARIHYFNSKPPPREIDKIPDPVSPLLFVLHLSPLLNSFVQSGALLTVYFKQGDASYGWMLAFLVSSLYSDIFFEENTKASTDILIARTRKL